MDKTIKDYTNDALAKMTDEERIRYNDAKQRDKERWHALGGAFLYGAFFGFFLGLFWDELFGRFF